MLWELHDVTLTQSFVEEKKHSEIYNACIGFSDIFLDGFYFLLLYILVVYCVHELIFTLATQQAFLLPQQHLHFLFPAAQFCAALRKSS